MNQSTAGQTRRTRCLGVAVALVAAVLALCGLQPRATAAQEPPPPPQVASQAPANDTLIAVEGEVLDAVSGVPVAAAIVVLAGGPTTFSDRMGYFRFEAVPPGTYSLRVFRVGYATVEARTPIDGQEVLVIRMDPGPIPLEGIEVRVRSRDELERRAAGSPVGIIGPVEMERLSQRYLTMAKSLPGGSWRAPVSGPQEASATRVASSSRAVARAVAWPWSWTACCFRPATQAGSTRSAPATCSPCASCGAPKPGCGTATPERRASSSSRAAWAAAEALQCSGCRRRAVSRMY